MHAMAFEAGNNRLWVSCVFFLLSFACVAEDDITKLLDERVGMQSQRDIHGEQQAIAKTRQFALLRKGGQILEQVDLLSAEISSWNQKTKALLNNEQGRAIAGDESLVAGFSVLYDKKRMTANEVSAIKNKVLNLLAPVQSARDEQSLYVPGDDLMREVEREQMTISEALLAYQKSQQQLSALLTKANASEASTVTLEVVLAKFKTAQAEQMTQADLALQERLRAEIQQARNERAERLARLEIELIKKKTDQEEQLLRSRAAYAGRLKAEEAAYTALKRRAENPIVQRKYAPFLAKGNKILTHKGAWKVTQTPTPLSMTGLMQFKALDRAKRFSVVATTKHNDRPKWNRPDLNSDYGEYEILLEEFKKLAPIWVEMGLLNP